MSVLDEAYSEYDWDASAKRVEGLMRKHYPLLLQLAYADASRELPVTIYFDLTNPRVKETIDGLAKRIRKVSDTTREDVRRWIDKGTEEGLSMPKIAEQIRSSAADISQSRAMMIARTESREAYNGGALLAYDTAGVSKVEALDSDNDEECAARDGQIYTLEEAAQVDPHPNCVLAWAPVVE